MPIAKIDNINKLRSIPYNKYFGEMQLNNQQKAERIALAEDIEDLMLVLFVLLPKYIDDIERLKESIYIDLIKTVSERVVVDETIDKHLKDTFSEIIDTTLKNQNKNEYWLSQDRAMVIAENESNTVFNHSDYVTAIENGFTKKRWLTELDEKVRESHIVLESETIDIDDVFVVGNSLMKYPHDTSLSPDLSEIIGCRCVCEYIK